MLHPKRAKLIIVEYEKCESSIYTQERVNYVSLRKVFFKPKEETALR